MHFFYAEKFLARIAVFGFRIPAHLESHVLAHQLHCLESERKRKRLRISYFSKMRNSNARADLHIQKYVRVTYFFYEVYFRLCADAFKIRPFSELGSLKEMKKFKLICLCCEDSNCIQRDH